MWYFATQKYHFFWYLGVYRTPKILKMIFEKPYSHGVNDGMTFARRLAES